MKGKVLIVEDETIVAEDLKQCLEDHGYEVIGIADSGPAAIEKAKEKTPHLILMDVRIKGELNGIETAIVLQSHFEDQIPVIFLTSFPESGFPYLKALDRYIYVNKPFIEDRLLAAVKRAIETRLDTGFGGGADAPAASDR